MKHIKTFEQLNEGSEGLRGHLPGDRSKQWNKIIEQIEDLGYDLDNMVEKNEDGDPVDDEIASALSGLRMAIDHLREQEIPD